MNRYQAALTMEKDAIDLEGVADRFLNAVREVKAEGRLPENDPAVMLIGGTVAFWTHADVGTQSMYRQLIDLCESRAVSANVAQFHAAS